MSKNLPETQPSEEIDLGQLFKLIGNAFERLFKFIGSNFYKLFLVFVWGVFFTKRHFWKLVIAVVLGIVMGLVKQKIEAPIYKSTMVIKQNYDTGEHLYNTIEYYNSLIEQQDSVEVAKILNITEAEAGKIVGLKMESNLTENQKLILFDEYTKGLDSVLASTIKYKDFLENSKDYNYDIQKLTLKSTSKFNFNSVLNTVVDNIEKNDFFKNLKEKQIDDLYRKDTIIKESLKESRTLQEVYKEVLQKDLEELPSGATTNIAIGGTKDQNTTKEYELFNNDLVLRRELVRNEATRKNLENIIEIVSSQDGEGTRENNAKLFGFETSWVIAICVKLVLATFFLLLMFEFIKFLERYKDEVS